MIRPHEMPFAVLCPIGVGLLLTFPVSMWSRFTDTVLESPITKQWVTPSYPETDGPIVHATEVDGVLETEGEVAVANADLDRYAAFHRCFKGPKWIIVRFNDAIYFTRGTNAGVLMWPAATEDGWSYWIIRTVPRDCEWWDFDGDSDVDLRDFADFQKGGG